MEKIKNKMPIVTVDVDLKITPQMRLLIAVMDNIDMWTDSGDTDYLRKAIAEIRAQIEREEEHE